MTAQLPMHNDIEAMIARYGVQAEVSDFLKQRQMMFIDGNFVDHDQRLDVIEPSTGKHLADIPSANIDHVNDAVAAAKKAMAAGDWEQMKPNSRQKLLLKLADLIEERAQIIAEIETIDNGKALGPCIEIDVLSSADLIRHMAGYMMRIEGATRSVSTPGENIAMTLREPIGVVGAIVPWNWPFNMAIWKLAAPLAAGCAVVLKPAQQTSLSVLYFAQLCQEAGMPAGVINIVTGGGSTVGQAIVNHPDISKISFTGSTPVGREIGASAGRELKPVTLELGGKSPMVAFADADFSKLADATRWSIFFNAGQVCSSGSRLYVERSAMATAIEAIKSVAQSMKICPGLDPECDLGPVISDTQFDNILAHIEKARADGLEIICGGNVVEGDGYFIEPTVIIAPDNSHPLVQEEIFGPVLVVLPFDSEEEALNLANDSEFGLAASVWTQDLSRAFRIVRALEAGTVWVNAHDLVDNALPFGGVKASGYGKDLGPEQLEHYLKTKSVMIADLAPPAET